MLKHCPRVQVHMKGIAKTLVGVRLSALASSGDDITEGEL